MAFVNSISSMLKNIRSALSADGKGVLAEGPENVGHGDHKIYAQGVITTTKKDDSIKDLIMTYQNTISKKQIQNILTQSNINSKRNDITASDQGKGIDEVFWKFGKKVTILTYDDETGFFQSWDWKINKQHQKMKNLEDAGRDMNINILADKFVNSVEDDDGDDLSGRILNLFKRIKKAFLTKQLDYPRTIFFITLRDEYQVPKSDTQDEYTICNLQKECMDFFSFKYCKLEIDIYFIEDDENNESQVLIKKLPKIDIIGSNYRQDTITCMVKVWDKTDVLIKFIDENDVSYFFSLIPNGTRPRYLQNLCDNSGNPLESIRDKWIKRIKNWKDIEHSFTVEYYGIRYDKLPYDKHILKYFKNKTYSGIYVLEKLLNTEGYILLNSIPFKVEECFNNTKGGFKNNRHVGGYGFRCIVKVNSKSDTLNTAPRRIETQLYDYTKIVIGSIHATLWRIYYKSVWENKKQLCLDTRKASKFVSKNKIMELLYADIKRRQPCDKFFNTEHIQVINPLVLPVNIPLTQKKEKKEKLKKNAKGIWYARLYEKQIETDEEIQVSYIIKQGTCYVRRESDRAKELNKKFAEKGFIFLSGINLSNLLDMNNEVLQRLVSDYWDDENNKKYYPRVIDGHKTDQCDIYKYEHWFDFKRIIDKVEDIIHNLENQDTVEWKKVFISTPRVAP